MNYAEKPVVFDCAADSLVGVVSVPAVTGKRGVLILVGGPQYRAGAHRQFIHLARHLAASGIPSMRFDFRGMGDSTGDERTFRYVDEDIAAAVDAFSSAVPDMDGIVLWGLCGGASAACLYAPSDPRVCGLILVNPWLRTESTAAKVYLKHYYVRRVFDPSFWKKLVAGQLGITTALTGLVDTARRARGDGPGDEGAQVAPDPLPERMLAAIGFAGGRTALFLSGRDYVAKAFEESLMSTPDFRRLEASGAMRIVRFEQDDHTFSSAPARARIEQATADWVSKLAK